MNNLEVDKCINNIYLEAVSKPPVRWFANFDKF